MNIDTSFLPILSQFDVERAAQLIQQAYSPIAQQPASADDLKRLQHELFELQKRPEAWGLVVPLLEHQDPNVQFFGAHTAQVKIARDWDSFPQENAERLRDLIIQLTARSMAIGRAGFILRKLFVALTSLALKLVSGHPTRWPAWITSTVTFFSGQGSSPELVHEFLGIVAEEVGNADLLGPSKLQMQQSVRDATPMVLQVVRSSLEQTQQIPSGLRCLQAWMSHIPSSDITPLIPFLIALLDRSPIDATIFIAASDTLQEIMSKSALSDGSGSRTLTEPVLLWLDASGNRIIAQTKSMDDGEHVSHSLCKLLVAIGDHSAAYFAAHIASPAPVRPLVQTLPPLPGSTGSAVPLPMLLRMDKTKGDVSQAFIRLLLHYTSLPGYYGADEEDSEMTLAFWYLFQESLWNIDYYFDMDEIGTAGEREEREQLQQHDVKPHDPGMYDMIMSVAKAVYGELVQVLRRKVVFPPSGSGWSKDQVDKFQVYRRDVGDTLINAYYILRDDMLTYLLNDLMERLDRHRDGEGWEEIEATLHCIMSIQEAMDMEKSPLLARLFSPEVMGRLPSTGHNRARRTMLSLIGTYSAWFASQPSSDAQATSALLMSVVSYAVSALADPVLSLPAASALRYLCDANRKALAPHIAAFAELHAGLGSVPDAEKGKVLQSIASVIQALPAMEQVAPIEGIVNPVIQRLAEALQNSVAMPDESRALGILQLEILSGVAKGLTRTNDGVAVFLSEDSGGGPAGDGDSEETRLAETMRTRDLLPMIELRESIFTVVRSVVDVWSGDVGVGNALSDLFKSITCLPADVTLISLPAGPILELVCLASQRHLTAIWLSLATILIAQLNPPPGTAGLLTRVPSSASSAGSVSSQQGNARGVTGATVEAEAVVANALPVLLECSLRVLGVPGAMADNPDIVQEFFACMDRVAQDFTHTFYSLPPGALDALMACAVTALALQERYSLVSACNFLGILIHRTSIYDALRADKERLLQAHGKRIMKAVLEGFAGVAPRSAVPNLIELLGTLIVRSAVDESNVAIGWMREVLFADDFMPSKATNEVKEKFLKAVMGSRSLKKTRDAAHHFTLVARGLEGSGFGYASVTM